MKELVIYVLEVLACSGILLLAYHILLERRKEFRLCRTYLLLAPVISAIIPLLNIPVWAAEIIYLQKTSTATPIDTTPMEMPAMVEMEVTQPIDPLPYVWGIYGLGVAVALFLMFYQFWAIRRLEREGEIIRNVPLVIRAGGNISSFSFFGTIYVGCDSTDEDVESIMIHEYSHIRHNHSAERVAMELLRALSWWNPFVWIMQRRLMEVHEFEADTEVLERGYDVSIYIQTILKSLLGYSPDIANGLRDSLTKKRFKMMTQKTPSRYALLRKLALLPVLAGLLCTFSFTAKATQYIEEPTEKSTNDTISKIVSDGKTIQVTFSDTNGNRLKNAILEWNAHFIPSNENGVSKIVSLGAKVDELKFAYIGHEVKSTSVYIKENTTFVDVVMETIPIPLKTVRVNNFTATKTSAYKSSSNASFSNRQIITKDGFVRIEEPAYFNGGDFDAFSNYLKENLRYPEEAIKAGAKGNFRATFVIEADGRLTNIQVNAPHPSFNEEVTRVIKNAPAKWSPATMRGEAVRTAYQVPITFSLEEDDHLTRLFSPVPRAAYKDNGMEGFGKYMMENLRYPQKGDEYLVGRVVASFYINDKKVPDKINIMMPVNDVLADEVKRVISESRGWEMVDALGDWEYANGYTVIVDFIIQNKDGIRIYPPIREELKLDNLTKQFGRHFIGPINVVAYTK